MAISTKSTKFLASPVTQKVVNDIYTGRVIFSIAATRSVLADNYKHRSIQVSVGLEISLTLFHTFLRSFTIGGMPPSLIIIGAQLLQYHTGNTSEPHNSGFGFPNTALSWNFLILLFYC